MVLSGLFKKKKKKTVITLNREYLQRSFFLGGGEGGKDSSKGDYMVSVSNFRVYSSIKGRSFPLVSIDTVKLVQGVRGYYI